MYSVESYAVMGKFNYVQAFCVCHQGLKSNSYINFPVPHNVTSSLCPTDLSRVLFSLVKGVVLVVNERFPTSDPISDY